MKNTILCAALFIGLLTVPLAAEENGRLDNPDYFTYVCKDGGNGGYEAFPDVCRLADGRLLCVFYDGWGHVSAPSDDPNQPEHKTGGRITGCYSSDEGKTWSEPAVMIDTPADDRDPSVCQLADGRLLCNWFTEIPKPGAAIPWEWNLMIAESADGGATWSEPRLLYNNVLCSTPIRVLSTGRLIMPTYVELPGEAFGSVLISDDAGKTWSENIEIPNSGMKLDAETDILERTDGSLLAMQRENMAFSVSADRGETWSASEPIGFPGHCPYLLRDKSGTVVMAVRLPNTSLYLSGDEGKTWSEPILVDNFIGAYPSMVELKDGSILIVYYEEGEGSNIRARRFKVSDSRQVEWLPL